MELAIQERALAQPMAGGDAPVGRGIGPADAGAQHALAGGLVHQEQPQVIVDQRVVQSTHHFPANIRLVASDGQVGAELEQGCMLARIGFECLLRLHPLGDFELQFAIALGQGAFITAGTLQGVVDAAGSKVQQHRRQKEEHCLRHPHSNWRARYRKRGQDIVELSVEHSQTGQGAQPGKAKPDTPAQKQAGYENHDNVTVEARGAHSTSNNGCKCHNHPHCGRC